VLHVAQVDGDLGNARFALLETMREFALERLVARGGEHDARARHATYFRALAESAARDLHGPSQAGSLARLDAEHEDLRAAMQWSTQQRRVDDALRLGGALWRYWQLRGHITEGRERLMQALALQATSACGDASAAW